MKEGGWTSVLPHGQMTLSPLLLLPIFSNTAYHLFPSLLEVTIPMARCLSLSIWQQPDTFKEIPYSVLMLCGITFYVCESFFFFFGNETTILTHTHTHTPQGLNLASGVGKVIPTT